MSNTLIVRNEEGGRLTGQLCRFLGGKRQSSCFLDLLRHVRKKVGMAHWPPAAMQLITWRAVLPWQEISPTGKQNKNKTKPKKHCFLSDQYDVLRDGWSVELEAVQGPGVTDLAGLWLRSGPTGVLLLYS